MTSELDKRKKTEVGTTAAETLGGAGPAYSPDVDVYVSDDDLVFAVDIPGVGKGDVSIEIDENDALVIKAKNSRKEPENPLLRQFHVGDYYRAFEISDEYDKEKVSAKLENGLLGIRIPKKESAKPRKIEIKA